MVVITLTLSTKAGQELPACGWMLSNHLTLDSLALSFDSVYLRSLYQVVGGVPSVFSCIYAQSVACVNRLALGHAPK